jgi:hypothetical protein
VIKLLIFSATKLILRCFFTPRSPGSSVSIVSHYGLDDRAIGVRSSTGAKDFYSILCVQTGSGVHPVYCTMGTGGPFPGAKRGRGVTLTTEEWVGAIPPLPPQAPWWYVAGLLLLFTPHKWTFSGPIVVQWRNNCKLDTCNSERSNYIFI